MSADQPIRIVVADDHPIVREGFSSIVEAESDLTVVAQAADGREAVAAVAEHSPDIVLMDLRMPELDGVAAITEIRGQHPDVRCIVLTTFDNDELVYDAVRAGARGFLLKDVSPVELLDAIRTVHGGGSLIQPVAIERLLDRLGPERPAQEQPVEDLTRREAEVLQIMARGARNREIAEELVIAERTVKIHVANVIAKLGTTNRTAAVVKALDLGLVDR
jgi:DNA-binding NarL/FixJ family response regulator